MRYLIAVAAVALIPAASAQAGCLTGAAAGCAVGHHNAKKKQQQAQPQTNGQTQQ